MLLSEASLIWTPVRGFGSKPAGDLDAQSAEEILAIIERLNREFKKTVVLVTHDPRAAQHATVIRHLDKGVLLPA